MGEKVAHFCPHHPRPALAVRDGHWEEQSPSEVMEREKELKEEVTGRTGGAHIQLCRPRTSCPLQSSMGRRGVYILI